MCSDASHFLKELADYEKMPDGPKIDAKGTAFYVILCSFFPFKKLIWKEWNEFKKNVNQYVMFWTVLEKDGFGSRTFFESFVAVEKETNEIVGYALYFFTYSTWQGKSLYLEDIYVQPNHRSKVLDYYYNEVSFI